jgi:hypothetical protein
MVKDIALELPVRDFITTVQGNTEGNLTQSPPCFDVNTLASDCLPSCSQLSHPSATGSFPRLDSDDYATFSSKSCIFVKENNMVDSAQSCSSHRSQRPNSSLTRHLSSSLVLLYLYMNDSPEGLRCAFPV